MISVGMAKRDLEEALQPKMPVGEERVEAVALYARSEDTELIWAVLDFMDFNRKVTDTVRKAVCLRTGVKESHVHILTTHNHGGGTPDLHILAELTAQCADEAKSKAAVAEIRCVLCETPRQVTYTRRIFVPELDGATTLFYGVSEKSAFDASPHVEYKLRALREGRLDYCGTCPTERPYVPFSPGDPVIAAVQFARPEGGIIGTAVRFAAHATCSNAGDSFSSDYPWQTRRYMEERFGGTAMYLNGPCGNIAPGNAAKRDGTSKKLGMYIAGLASEALEKAAFEPFTVLRDEKAEIRLPVRREVLEESVLLPETMPQDLPGRLRYLERKRLSDTLPFLESKYREGECGLSDTVPVFLGFMQMNGMYVAAFPGETFRETADALRSAFPDRMICTVTEHERTVMYIPPEEQCVLGGYEPTCMVTAPGAEMLLREQAAAAFGAFAGKGDVQ